MDTPYIGAVVLFAGNFAPRGWAFCQGQILSIAQNTALFSILGTTYGGNGQTTFALPDLRGRVPMSQGQGPGLSANSLGEQIGTETVTLIATQMPAHTHAVTINNAVGNNPSASGNYLAQADYGGDPINVYSNALTTPGVMAANSVGIAGGSQPHNNMQPTLCMNYIIALEGIYPSRA